MNQRVERLRQQTLEQRPWLSIERAKLMTEFDQQCQEASAPMRRALALQYLMERKEIYIGKEN